jgi:hypothetical protein
MSEQDDSDYRTDRRLKVRHNMVLGFLGRYSCHLSHSASHFFVLDFLKMGLLTEILLFSVS